MELNRKVVILQLTIIGWTTVLFGYSAYRAISTGQLFLPFDTFTDYLFMITGLAYSIVVFYCRRLTKQADMQNL